jgi:protein-S-isoprenylcysteine O-methyltransferase
LEAVDPGHVDILEPGIRAAVQIVGLATYVLGFAVMAWALVALQRSYQLGGLAPRPEDRMVTSGPYRVIRHPMYAAVLLISFGLACLTQSVLGLAVVVIYLALLSRLIPIEESRLLSAYGESYAAYRRGTKRLVPFVY